MDAGAPRSSCGIAIMAKASAPGRTKTRLVPPLSFEEAAQLNTAFLQDIAANIQAAARVVPIAGYAAYGPAGAHAFFERTLPDRFGHFEASLPNFGDCLQLAIETILARGHGSAAVLNSDSPTLPPVLLGEMADALARPGDRAVLGPSADGGYYVLGLKHLHRRLFEDIAWSTSRVAEQTLARAREIGLPVHVLPIWYDIDDAASLRVLHDELFLDIPFDEGKLDRGESHHTRALLQRWVKDDDFRARLGGNLTKDSSPPSSPESSATMQSTVSQDHD
jgi:rSAM/selenodomain-associated transferase 1